MAEVTCYKDWNLDMKCLSEAQSVAVEENWKASIKGGIKEGGGEIEGGIEGEKKYQTLEEYRKAIYQSCMQHARMEQGRR